jgi:hypothetical protein
MCFTNLNSSHMVVQQNEKCTYANQALSLFWARSYQLNPIAHCKGHVTCLNISAPGCNVIKDLSGHTPLVDYS